MKGQIIKHEWVAPKDYGEGIAVPKWIKVCPHCKTRRINASEGGYLYKVYGDHLQMASKEPPCITRPEKEADNNE